MPTHLTDTREMTEQDADRRLQQIFSDTLAIMRAEAAAEAEIEAIRDRLQADTAAKRQTLEANKAKIDAYIHAHPERFKQPRMRTTAFGKYGFRKSTRTKIADAKALIQYAKNQGYTDLYEVVEKANKSAISSRLRDGEKLPGCRLDVGQMAEYKLDTAALEEQM